ncbi:MAG TPA: acyl carrier protein [Thermoanaerobaculia bacterium]|jgi:acyl carrier protein|nr:acyl carrier protein [Thermoanaerobaculia bacterium]
MPETLSSPIAEILWESLKGGDYDIPALKKTVHDDSKLEDIGLDSLDMTDFFIRVEDQYKISIQREEYPRLGSLRAIELYVKEKTAS